MKLSSDVSLAKFNEAVGINSSFLKNQGGSISDSVGGFKGIGATINGIVGGAEPKTIFEQVERDMLTSLLPKSLPDHLLAQEHLKILTDLASKQAIIPRNPVKFPTESTPRLSGYMQETRIDEPQAMREHKKAVELFKNNPYDQARELLHSYDALQSAEDKEAFLKQVNVGQLFAGVESNKKSYGAIQRELPDVDVQAFKDNLLMLAGESGLIAVTPEDALIHAQKSSTLTAGLDLNISTGRSLIGSSGEEISLFAQESIGISSAQGQVELSAQNNSLNLVSDKKLTIVSGSDKVEVLAATELVLACGGAYIRIKDGDIQIHAPGSIDHKAGQHGFSGPTSEVFGTNGLLAKGNWIGLRKLGDNMQPDSFRPYRIEFEDGSVLKGVLDEQGYSEHHNVPKGIARVFYEHETVDDHRKKDVGFFSAVLEAQRKEREGE